MATDNPTKKVKNRCVMQAVFPPKKHLYAIRCKRKILRLHLSVEPSCTRKILRIMRIAKVIAAAVPTISFGQNLVTEKPKVPQTQLYQGFAGLVVQFELTPTRCRDLHLKQFCLEDIAPTALIILIAHIILAVRWMLIKILSVVINSQEKFKVIVPGSLNVLYHTFAYFST